MVVVLTLLWERMIGWKCENLTEFLYVISNSKKVQIKKYWATER